MVRYAFRSSVEEGFYGCKNSKEASLKETKVVQESNGKVLD